MKLTSTACQYPRSRHPIFPATRLSLDMKDATQSRFFLKSRVKPIFPSLQIRSGKSRSKVYPGFDASIEQVLAIRQNIRCEIIDNSLIVLLPNTGTLQQQKVTGVVTDASSGEALAGVNIMIEGTNQGVITDMNGNYSIEVPGPASVLIFSYIGYVSERIEVGSQSAINVNLVLDIQSLKKLWLWVMVPPRRPPQPVR
jgi:hypothetical protein